MRVAKLADLTDTTVRTVRYYHAIGLLPVPSSGTGWRDYELEHVARLSRIRWLTDAGVPLATIGGLLSTEAAATSRDQRESILADLRATISGVEEQLGRLGEQRERLVALVESVESGSTLTPMPPRAVAFYDRLEAGAADDRTRRAVRDERDFVELAYYRGQVPPEAALLFAGLDDAGLQKSLAEFGRDPDQALADEEIEELAAGVVARMQARFGPDLAAVARNIDLDMVRGTYELFERTVTGSERLIAKAIMRRLEAEIMRWRS